jgi:hypothetical protein
LRRRRIAPRHDLSFGPLASSRVVNLGALVENRDAGKSRDSTCRFLPPRLAQVRFAAPPEARAGAPQYFGV